jgi:hypothetical protein
MFFCYNVGNTNKMKSLEEEDPQLMFGNNLGIKQNPKSKEEGKDTKQEFYKQLDAKKSFS